MSKKRILFRLLFFAGFLASFLIPNPRVSVAASAGQQDVRLDNPAVAFSPDRDIALRIKATRVEVDGKVLFSIRGETGGFVIWFYSPKYGRFIFSTKPHPKYEFEEVDVIDNNKIVFRSDSRRFEWIFEAPLVEKGTITHLWMMHDQHPEPIKDRKQDGGQVGAATHYEYLLPSH